MHHQNFQQRNNTTVVYHPACMHIESEAISSPKKNNYLCTVQV